LKGASDIDDAVNQFYENPDKYPNIAMPSAASAPPAPSNTIDHAGDTKGDAAQDGDGGYPQDTKGGDSHDTSGSHAQDTKEASPVYAPPPYAPPPKNAPSGKNAPPATFANPASNMRAVQHRPHTNPVIEAGHVRSRDEVCYILATVLVIG
jgi:hypothetical protein